MSEGPRRMQKEERVSGVESEMQVGCCEQLQANHLHDARRRVGRQAQRHQRPPTTNQHPLSSYPMHKVRVVVRLIPLRAYLW